MTYGVNLASKHGSFNVQHFLACFTLSIKIYSLCNEEQSGLELAYDSCKTMLLRVKFIMVSNV